MLSKLKKLKLTGSGKIVHLPIRKRSFRKCEFYFNCFFYHNFTPKVEIIRLERNQYLDIVLHNVCVVTEYGVVQNIKS